MKKLTMVMLLSVSTAAWFSCSTNDGSAEIKNVAKQFFTALSRQNYDEAASYATPETKASLELIKNLAEMGKKMAESVKPDISDSVNAEIEAKLAKVVYGEPVIEGDKATLPITVDNETNNIYLKKIDGVWKVAFDKSSMKQIMSDKSGKSIGEINAELDSAAKELQNLNLDSVKEALNKAGDVLKSDSVQKALDAAGDALKKVGDAMKEMSKEGKQ